MKCQLQFPAKRRFGLFTRRRQKPCDFVFVLVGQRFVVTPGDRFFQLRILHPIHQTPILPRKALGLIPDQMRFAKRDHCIQRFRLFNHICRDHFRRPVRVHRRPPANFKGAQVLLNLRAV